MSFNIAQKPSYKTPVKVHTPNDKGGFDTSDFIAHFKRVSMDDIEALKELPQKEVLQQVLVGYSGLLDEDDKEIDFNETNVTTLFNIPQALAALTTAFWSSIFRAKEKN
jgi:hypothetical protein